MRVQITLSIANASDLNAVAIASDLNLHVVSQNLTQVFLLSDVSPLRELPADFPPLDPFDPATPYIASSEWTPSYNVLLPALLICLGTSV